MSNKHVHPVMEGVVDAIKRPKLTESSPMIDHAKEFWRKQGFTPLPAEGTEEWETLYKAWALWSFRDLRTPVGKKLIRFTKIVWDTDGKSLKECGVPKTCELEVDADLDVAMDGAGVLSDKYGYCVQHFEWKEVLAKPARKPQTISDLAGAQKQVFQAHCDEFYRIFKVPLSSFWDLVTGLRIVQLDNQVIRSRDNESCAEAVERQWGPDATRLIQALLGDKITTSGPKK